ncbi:hypothetical protein [Pseudoxanthomonas mexicana]|uniref:hypothetical protein n=1 Tax=Pseudoxanthomonas mexicana TaxID=128785 RepID=UPI00398A8A93
MDFHGFDRHRALGNHDGLRVGTPRALAQVGGWERLQPAHVLELLDQAAPEVREDARNLAALLARMPWRIPPHSPLPGKASQLVSNAREVIISTVGRNFRLHLVQAPTFRLERITLQSA